MKSVFRIAGCLVAAAWLNVSAAMPVATVPAGSDLEALLASKTEQIDSAQSFELLAQKVQEKTIDQVTAQRHFLEILRRVRMPFQFSKGQDGTITPLFAFTLSNDSWTSFLRFIIAFQRADSLMRDFLDSMRPHEAIRFVADIMHIVEEKLCIGFTPTLAELRPLFFDSYMLVQRFAGITGDLQESA